MQRIKTNESGQVRGSSVVVFGASGVGKTRAIATLPVDETLIIAAEHGLMSLSDKGYEAVMLETIEDIENFAIAIMANDQNLLGGYKYLAIDGLSDLSEQVLLKLKDEVADSRQAYGQMQAFMYKVMKALNKLPMNTYITCKEATDEGKKVPMLEGGTLTARMPYEFDVIVQIMNITDNEGENKKVLKTFDDYKGLAKDRSGKLADYEEPNLLKLFQKLNTSECK